MKTYKINECFYSLQGEGMRAGTANVFVRFTGCNLACDLEPGPKSPGGFACDTEFASGRALTLEQLWEWMQEAVSIATGIPRETGRTWRGWIILTGGEPGLQVDHDLIHYFHSLGCKLAIETNGTVELPEGLDWITLSPKVAEHAVKQLRAHEVKYVRGYGQAVPKPAATADHYLLSPAFEGGQVDQRTMDWCVRLCLENPSWRLSLQTHKFLKVR